MPSNSHIPSGEDEEMAAAHLLGSSLVLDIIGTVHTLYFVQLTTPAAPYVYTIVVDCVYVMWAQRIASFNTAKLVRVTGTNAN